MRGQNNQMVRWTEEMIADLGRMTDNDVALKYSVHPNSVTYKRTSLGIKPYGVREWSELEVFMLGKLSDMSIAAKLGILKDTVQKKRRELKIPSLRDSRYQWFKSRYNDLKGLDDNLLAEILGVSSKTIRNYRNKIEGT